MAHVHEGGLAREVGLALEEVPPAHHVGEPPHPHARQELPDLAGDVEQVRRDVAALPAEAGHVDGVLGGDAGRAAQAAGARGVAGLGAREVALAEHRAADGDEHGGAEADAVGAQQGELQGLLAVLHAAVHAQLHEGAHALLHERVVDGGQDGGHGHPCVFLVHPLRRARASAAVGEVQAIRPRVHARPGTTISTPWVATYLRAQFTAGFRWRQLSSMSLTSSIE